MMKQQKGFTLIELIMVIVILGILSAFALPRFVNLSSDANDANVQGALASVRSANAMVHASYLAQNDTSVTTIDTETGSINITNGYPDATTFGSGGILDAANLESGDYQAYVGDSNNDGSGTPQVAVTAASATAGAECFIYTEAPDTSTAATTSALTWSDANSNGTFEEAECN